MQDFTVVLGIDGKTLPQLHAVLPTWLKHKPSLFKQPFLIFYDHGAFGVSLRHLYETRTLPKELMELQNVTWSPWPWAGRSFGLQYKASNVIYPGDDSSKWSNPQRHKMLAGFVHVPGLLVRTKYWLKIDTDVIATGTDDWVDESWFDGNPAMIASPWGYTKPADQMTELDMWADGNLDLLPEQMSKTQALKLEPKPGETAVKHKRIASWCAFFRTDFTKICSEAATRTVGPGLLPVPSQDGYLWYMAARMQEPIRRIPIKSYGWTVRNGIQKIKETVKEIL